MNNCLRSKNDIKIEAIKDFLESDDVECPKFNIEIADDGIKIKL